MATVLETIGPRSGSAPVTYTVTELGTVDVMSVFASFDGSAASGTFRPTVTVRSQSGAILARVFPTDTVAAGDSADVTFAPFLKQQATSVVASGGLTLIETKTASGATAAFDFTGIPGTYQNLLLIFYGRGDTAFTLVDTSFQFNGDTGANYDFQVDGGTAGTASASQARAQTQGSLGGIPAATADAGIFTGWDATIPAYATTVGQKFTNSKAGLKVTTTSGGMQVVNVCSYWRSSAAINRILIFPQAGSFVTGSTCSLYGVA